MKRKLDFINIYDQCKFSSVDRTEKYHTTTMYRNLKAATLNMWNSSLRRCSKGKIFSFEFTQHRTVIDVCYD